MSDEEMLELIARFSLDFSHCRVILGWIIGETDGRSLGESSAQGMPA